MRESLDRFPRIEKVVKEKDTFYAVVRIRNPETKKFSGDGCRDPPVPMPNTAVKPTNAESTWGEAPWEDRKPLIQVRTHTFLYVSFFYI